MSRRDPRPLLSLCVLALLCVGCGEPKGGPRLDVVPIQGEVFVDGEPAHEAFVHLHPVTEHVMPREGQVIASQGQVDEGGKYKISTYVQYDGAPPADYKITITWNEATGTMRNAWDGPDRLKGKYADVEKTEFRVTVPDQIEEDAVVIPRFDLTKKKGK
ncbi:MAG TPA: hypothetical protein P5307_21735 [Pirellulaceae bacterium]|nr:hypothetical protein [Pirellulaceae bacterium]